MSAANTKTTTEIVCVAGASINTQVVAPSTVGEGAADTAVDICPVCLRIEDRLLRAVLPCGHSMHADCIQDWVAHLESKHITEALEESTMGLLWAAALGHLPRPTCPTCRAEVVYPCGHAVRKTQFDAGPITSDHWAQLCTDCEDDEHGYDGFSDEDGGDGGSHGGSHGSGSAVS